MEFRRNQRTGIIETWENGKKTGEVVTMGDLITDEEKSHKKTTKTAPKKRTEKTSQD